jgi:HSP20 family protein
LASLDRRMFGDDWSPLFKRMKMPTTDIYTEDDKQMTIEVHLPNFHESDVTIDIDGSALVIQAEKREKEEDKDKKYVLRESSQSFYRSIELPEQADTAKASASFTKGVLTVTVPFTDLPAPRRIAIDSPSTTTE